MGSGVEGVEGIKGRESGKIWKRGIGIRVQMLFSHFYLVGFSLLWIELASNWQFQISPSSEPANKRPLAMEYAEDKASTQSKDAMLATLQELKDLSQTDKGHQRAALFHKLVSQLRGMNNETLGPAVHEMLKVSTVLTWQALPQCGTLECISGVLQYLQRFLRSSLEVDATVYAIGLLPQPNAGRVRDMLSMAQNRQNKAVMYGLSNSVRKYVCGVSCLPHSRFAL